MALVIFLLPQNTCQKSCLDLDKVISFEVLCISRPRLAVDDATTTYAIEHGNLFLHIIEADSVALAVAALSSVDIEDGVRDGTTGLGNFLYNVEAGLTENLVDVSENTGGIVAHDGKSDGVLSPVGKINGREVDGISDGAGFEEVSDLLGGHGSGTVLGLLGGGTEMGKDNHIVVVPEKVVGEVGNIPPIASVEELLHGL